MYAARIQLTQLENLNPDAQDLRITTFTYDPATSGPYHPLSESVYLMADRPHLSLNFSLTTAEARQLAEGLCKVADVADAAKAARLQAEELERDALQAPADLPTPTRVFALL